MCGDPIPSTRRSHAQFCSDNCRQKYRGARFRVPGADVTLRPGSYLVALQGETSGAVYVSLTRRLSQRIRLAKTGTIEPLTLIGIVDADAASATRFRAAHEPWKIRASWYLPSVEVLGYFAKRTLPLPATTAAAAAHSSLDEVSSEAAVPEAS